MLFLFSISSPAPDAFLKLPRLHFPQTTDLILFLSRSRGYLAVKHSRPILTFSGYCLSLLLVHVSLPPQTFFPSDSTLLSSFLQTLLHHSSRVSFTHSSSFLLSVLVIVLYFVLTLPIFFFFFYSYDLICD